MVLAQYFLRKETGSLKLRRVAFSPAAISALSCHDRPGNVREVQNRIRRALVTFSGPVITPDDLGLSTCLPDSTGEKLLTLQAARDRGERHCVKQALLLTGNNIAQAAKLLETSRPTLHDLIKKHGIRVD